MNAEWRVVLETLSSMMRGSAHFVLHTTRILIALLCILFAAPAAAVAEAHPIAQRLQVAPTCPSRGRPERSEDGRLGGAGRAQAAGRARNGVGTPNDAMGNLSGAAYVDGKVDLRMPDAVGNLFRSVDRSDRKYGPAGQLLESRDARGVTAYEYDAEGNLTKKVEPDGVVWAYEWNGAGMLTRVVRPNGHAVEFGYDPLARRTFKKYRGKTTRWIWDGNVPLHEWVERDADAVDEDFARAARADDAAAAAEKQLKAMLAGRPAQGPPINAAIEASIKAASSEGTIDSPVTWVFEPESFAPLAKIVGGERFGIVTDHLGTPRGMFDSAGAEVWAADIDAYGDLRDVRGERQACPFRWPGQYEDGETGLYYNRWRYYDPSSGDYNSSDPIGLVGGMRPFAYAADPLVGADHLGLKCTPDETPHVFWSGKGAMAEAEKWAEANGTVTLEMTARGGRAARHAEGLAWEEARPVWARQSKMFAKESAGDVHVFATPKALNNPESVFNTVELPALEKNPNVGNIIYHMI